VVEPSRSRSAPLQCPAGRASSRGNLPAWAPFGRFREREFATGHAESGQTTSGIPPVGRRAYLRNSVVIASFQEDAEINRDGYAVVAIDVIRATTTAITAVAAGRRCFPVNFRILLKGSNDYAI